jgi:outer membrane protein TolC
MMQNKILLSVMLGLPSLALAQSFEQVWQAAYKNSYSAKSYEAKLEAIQISKERSEKHWYPRLFLSSTVFQTDDPTYSFMGTLNQRSIEQADFSPSALNNPDTKTYQTHTLGAYLPIYEGGSKANLAKAKALELAATENEKQYADNMLYAEVAKLYGMYIVGMQTARELQSVEKEVKTIIQNYQLGSKENPMGRAGLLSLQTLNKRIDAELDQVNILTKTVLFSLEELTGLKEIRLDVEQIKNYVNTNLKSKVNLQEDESSKVKSLKKMMEVARAHQEAAKAYYLPQVGVFAQNNYYAGDRDQAQAQMVGLSVKWEFFNLGTFSTSQEAGKQALAAEAYAKAIAQQELLANRANLSKQQVVENNLVRLNEALKEMNEQTQINYKLFRNGIINVLQMSQVLNAKLDLIRFYDQTQNEYLKTWSDLYITKVVQK